MPKKIELDSVAAAKILGIQVKSVDAAARRGCFKGARKHGSSWVITKSALEEYLPRTRGRRPKRKEN